MQNKNKSHLEQRVEKNPNQQLTALNKLREKFEKDVVAFGNTV